MSFSRRADARFNRGRISAPPVTLVNGELTFVSSDGYSTSLTNAAVFRECSIAYNPLNGEQSIGWWNDSARHLVISRRSSLNSTVWTHFATSLAGNALDPHNVISLMYDGAGYLLVQYGMHGSPMHHMRLAPGFSSINSGDLVTLPLVAGNDAIEAQVTYPQFFYVGGAVLNIFRTGSSGDGDTVLYQHNADGTRLSRGVIITGSGSLGQNYSAYLQRPIYNPATGRFHLAWCWRATTNLTTNFDMHYMYSDDLGVTWKDISGSVLTLPVTPDNAPLAWTIPQNSGLDNTQGLAVDASDRPLITTYWDILGNGYSQYMLIWHNGTSWQAQQMGTEATAYSLVNQGFPATVPFGVPFAIFRNGKIIVIHRQDGRGPGIWIRVSQSPYTDWTISQLSNEKLGDWYTSIDERLFRATGRVQMYYQWVVRAPSPAPGATQVRIFEPNLPT